MRLRLTIIISTIALAIGITLWAYGIFIIPNQPIHKQDFLAGVAEAFIGIIISTLALITLIAVIPLKLHYMRHHRTTPTTQATANPDN